MASSLNSVTACVIEGRGLPQVRLMGHLLTFVPFFVWEKKYETSVTTTELLSLPWCMGSRNGTVGPSDNRHFLPVSPPQMESCEGLDGLKIFLGRGRE